jgi:hypothetical protein
MTISIASAKAKARRAQALVRERILALFPALAADDVKTAVMGERGADIILSPTAKAAFPYAVEVKARAAFSTATDYAQAERHCATSTTKVEPLLILKPDRLKPLAVISLDHFEALLRAAQGQHVTTDEVTAWIMEANARALAKARLPR